MIEAREAKTKRANRIVFLDHTAAMGGGEIALFNLVRQLDRDRFHPLVVLFSNGPLAERLMAAGIETRVIPFSAQVLKAGKDALGFRTLLRFKDVLHTLSYVFMLTRFLRSANVDLVHTNSLKSDIIGGLAARFARKPLVWHVRDRIEPDYLPKPVVRAFRWMCRWLPNRVIANSNATLETIRLGKTSCRGYVVYSGTVLQDNPSPENATKIEQHGEVVGLIGRISPWKGQHIFIEAAAAVRRKFPEARFQIVGAPLFEEREYERRLREMTESHGLNDRVEFLGFRQDIPQLIRNLDVLVHASVTGEPFGQVVVEGMAAGKPVVATNGGGIPEIVVDRVTGLLVPMGDAAAMADAICQILERPDRARDFGRRGRERVRNLFTVDHAARRVEALYDSLIRRK